MTSKSYIKKLLKEGFFGDVATDVVGDLAMGIVGGVDGIDLAVLIPMMIKNLRELKGSIIKIEETIPKFKEEASTYRDELVDYADDVVTDTIDLGQRIVEAMPGSWYGSATSFVGGGILSRAVVSATAIQELGEKFATIVNKAPKSLKKALDKNGLYLVPDALFKAGEALELVEAYDEFVGGVTRDTDLDEQEVGIEGGGVETGVSSSGGSGAKTWESGISRGAANPIGPTHWADSYSLSRGKANPLV